MFVALLVGGCEDKNKKKEEELLNNSSLFFFFLNDVKIAQSQSVKSK